MDKITKLFKGAKVESVVYGLIIMFVVIYLGSKLFGYLDKIRKDKAAAKALEGADEVEEVRDKSEIQVTAKWLADFFENSGWWAEFINPLRQNDLADKLEILNSFTDNEVRLLNSTFRAIYSEKSLYNSIKEYYMDFWNTETKEAALKRLERLGLIQ